MNPKWNPITLMVLGTLLTVFSYITALMFVENGFQATMGVILTSFGMLTVVSGIVLAYLHFFRDEPRVGRR